MEEKVSPREIWKNVKPHLTLTAKGVVLFDDTVQDKRYAKKMALVRRQYSGNAKGVINGIGVVTCVYVNPVTDPFWLIDYRIYDPEGDGKTKLDPVKEMLSLLVSHKKLPFDRVVMDTWYATKAVMLHIEHLQKTYYCPIKKNRLVDDSGGENPYQRVDALTWTKREQATGKRMKLRGSNRSHGLKVDCRAWKKECGSLKIAFGSPSEFLWLLSFWRAYFSPILTSRSHQSHKASVYRRQRLDAGKGNGKSVR